MIKWMESNYHMITDILVFFDIQNTVIALLFFVIFLFLTNPVLVERLHIFGLAILRTFKWARRLHTSRSFQLDIKSKSKELNKEIGIDILPHDIKVKLVRNTTRESFIKNGKVIVKLDDHEDRNRTVALATLNYVDKGLLPEARNYMPNEILESSCLLITHRLLTNNNPETLNFFISDILANVFKEKPLVEDKFKYLKALDDGAFFLQILIPELWEVGKIFYPNIPDEELLKEEVEELITFLYEIAVNNEELPPLNYKSKLFSIKIIIVGKYEKLAERGIDDYSKRVLESISMDFHRIYLLGHDNKKKYMQKIVDKFKDNPKVGSIIKREGRSIDKYFKRKISLTYCLNLKNNNVRKSEII